MRPEPTYLDALAYVAARVAEFAAYAVIAVGILGFGIITGWLG